MHYRPGQPSFYIQTSIYLEGKVNLLQLYHSSLDYDAFYIEILDDKFRSNRPYGSIREMGGDTVTFFVKLIDFASERKLRHIHLGQALDHVIAVITCVGYVAAF